MRGIDMIIEVFTPDGHGLAEVLEPNKKISKVRFLDKELEENIGMGLEIRTYKIRNNNTIDVGF